jgi:hypothetical protein
MSELTSDDGCRGCTATVRLAPGEVQRLLVSYLADHSSAALVDEVTYSQRLKACDTCADLVYGTTCRHCGCLVAVRAKLAEKGCSGVRDKWSPAFFQEGAVK